MIVKVHQTSFSHCGDYRDVEIEGNYPQSLWEHIKEEDGVSLEVLENVFYWGQNEHQGQDKPSVSMGDVAELWGRYWLCVSVGWKELSYEEWLNYLGMSLKDRIVYCFQVVSDNVPNVLTD